MSTTQESLRKEVEKSIVAREQRTLKQVAVLGQVDLNIDPSAIPLGSLDAEAFHQDLVGQFHCKFDDSEIVSMIPNEVRNQIKQSVLLRLAIENDKSVRFRGGLLKLPAISRTTQIDKMGLGSQQVSSVVHGSTDEAMLLCKTLCLSVWRASGFEKRWEDIESAVALSRFKTTTKVHFPFSLNRLLADPLVAFLDQEVAGPEGFGKFMGFRDVDVETHRKRLPEFRVVVTCREITLTVSTFNDITGRSEDNRVHFLIESLTNANRGVCFVTTELPVNEHVQLVERLVDHWPKVAQA